MGWIMWTNYGGGGEKIKWRGEGESQGSERGWGRRKEIHESLTIFPGG